MAAGGLGVQFGYLSWHFGAGPNQPLPLYEPVEILGAHYSGIELDLLHWPAVTDVVPSSAMWGAAVLRPLSLLAAVIAYRRLRHPGP